jgi:glycosidase
MTNVLQGRTRATELRAAWEQEVNEWPRASLHMRFSDNHDERRAVARFGEPAALAASAFVFTLDGVPMLYNGMEVGDTTESGAPALFEKLPIFWPIAERRPEFGRFYKQIIELRRSSPALRRGTLEWLHNSDEARVISFQRRTANEEIVVAINFSNSPFTGTIEVARGSEFIDVTPDVGQPLPPDAPGFAGEGARAKSIAGLPAMALPSWGYRIFRRR